MSFCLAFAAGCTGGDDQITSVEKDDAALAAALRDIQVAHEFVELFPSNHGGVYYSPKTDAQRSLKIITLPYDRYKLSLTMKIEYDPKTAKAKANGNPEFQLNEIERIESYNSGSVVTARYKNQEVFGSNQWHQIYQNHGEFSAAGFTIITNKPINGIEKLKLGLLNSSH